MGKKKNVGKNAKKKSAKKKAGKGRSRNKKGWITDLGTQVNTLAKTVASFAGGAGGAMLLRGNGGGRRGIDMGGSGSRSMVTAPVSVGTQFRSRFDVKSISSSKYKGAIKMLGMDVLSGAVFDSAGDNQSGRGLLNIQINPTSFVGTRLALTALQYTRFIVRKLAFHYQPSVGTNTDGAYMMAYDPDCLDAVPDDGDQALRQIGSWQDSVSGSVFTPFSCVTQLRAPKDPLWIRESSQDVERNMFQGQFVFTVFKPITVLSGNAIADYPVTTGEVWFEYEVDFYDSIVGNPCHGLQISNYSAVNSTLPSTTANGGWNDFLALTPDIAGDDEYFNYNNSSNAGIYCPSGLYLLTQTVSGEALAAGPVTLLWEAPGFFANDQLYTDAFAVEPFPYGVDYNNAFTLDGGDFFNYSQCWLVSVPTGGGKILGNWGGSNNSTVEDINISVCIMDASPNLPVSLPPPLLTHSRVRLHKDPITGVRKTRKCRVLKDYLRFTRKENQGDKYPEEDKLVPKSKVGPSPLAAQVPPPGSPVNTDSQRRSLEEVERYIIERKSSRPSPVQRPP